MSAADLLREWKLVEAREALVARLKGAPGDTKARTLLFQTLAFCGEWEKVGHHLEVLIEQLPESATGILAYRNMALAEKTRLAVACGVQVPQFMTEPPAFVTDLLEARKHLSAGDSAKGCERLASVEEQSRGVTGRFGDEVFSGFSDGDALFAGIIEVFVHDRYLWVPIAAVRELSVQKPRTLLETLWAPGRIVTWEGLTTDCFFPTLYPESFRHDNSQVRMGRMTDWVELGAGRYRGVGQHLFWVGNQEKGLLELTEIAFDFSSNEGPA